MARLRAQMRKAAQAPREKFQRTLRRLSRVRGKNKKVPPKPTTTERRSLNEGADPLLRINVDFKRMDLRIKNERKSPDKRLVNEISSPRRGE
ncbi:hypothetical protein CEXT_11281 [Caerostris extrusa]|uniref:Uncharacterized protein n=1 Tax=Caerostris extrusa TaxID=172846 RepID=A0AAV4MUR6_CAEEX|nr:hypothetical protein CEXT_11281 [Caerostris extrusa]